LESAPPASQNLTEPFAPVTAGPSPHPGVRSQSGFGGLLRKRARINTVGKFEFRRLRGKILRLFAGVLKFCNLMAMNLPGPLSSCGVLQDPNHRPFS